MKVWPFVIAVGKYEDFDYVVLPAVIPEGSKNFWRVREFRANQVTDGILVFRPMINNALATCVYRTMHVEDKECEPVVDSAGRPIFKTVGFLTFDALDADKHVWSRLISALDTTYREVIDRFVNHSSPPLPEWRPVPSDAQTVVSEDEPGWVDRVWDLVRSGYQSRIVVVCCLLGSLVLNIVLLGQVVRLYYQKRALIYDLNVAVERQKPVVPQAPEKATGIELPTTSN